MIINYEEVVDDYNGKLLTKLRSHGSSFDYLEMWVPDENHVKSILNMVEAAETYGKQDIQISILNDTLTSSELKLLVEEIQKIGNISVDSTDGGKLLAVTALQAGSSAITENLDESFHQGFSEIAEQIDHQGEIDVVGEEEKYDATENGVNLSVVVIDGVIAKAVFSGELSAQQQVIMEVFCRVIEELPLQEAADHAALNTLYGLFNKKCSRPVKGIMMVENVDSMFKLSQNLIREINKIYRKDKNVQDVSNFWIPHLSKDWLMLSVQGKIDRIDPIISDFQNENELLKDDIHIENIEKDIRVIVSFSGNVAADPQPRLLMKLEEKIRTSTGKRLEIYAQERQDANRIRRIKIN